MDDFIHSAVEMTGPLGPTLRATFGGTIDWSGYRPLSTAMRVLLTHAFGLERMWGYYVIYLSLHFINTLLTFRIVRRVGGSDLWAFCAAAIVLLLPSHNEAVFWFAANSNVLALLFSLLALDLALTAFERPSLGIQLGVALAYLCAVLAYEVTLALPALIFTADWIVHGRVRRSRLRLYFLLAGAAVVMLLVRFAVQGSLVPGRGDYAASLDAAHLLRGYHLLLSQMVLLFTSPSPGAPIFGYSRNWLEPTGSLALATMALALGVTAVAFITALRSRPITTPESSASTRWLWIGWGILWMLLMGFAFASLTGRNPENRYTYLLSFGFAVTVASFVAMLYSALRRVRPLQFALLGMVAGLIAFYAYVSMGDGVDWRNAGTLVRATQASIKAAIPALDNDQSIGQIGIPASVGSAYTYTVERAFQDAMFLLYGQGQPGFADNQSLRAWFRENPDIGKRTFAFTWDESTSGVVPIVAVLLCNTYDDCQYTELRRPEGTSKNRGVRYVQIYDTENPQLGGVALYATLDPYAVRGCYIFQDYNVETDPAAFWDYPQDQRCADAITAFWDYSE